MNVRTGTAYKREIMKGSQLPQRVLLVVAAVLYAGASWRIQSAATEPLLSGASLAFLVLTFAVFGLTFSSNSTARLDAAPPLASLIFGAQTVTIVTFLPNGSEAIFSASFTLLGFISVALALHLRAAALALLVVAALGAFGSAFVMPAAHSGFSTSQALLLWLPGLGVAGFLAWALEKARRKAFVLSRELERRATSDDLTGVSNRAHINLLAQNEFARARRYKEPYSCLMLEVDEYDALRSKWGVHAADVVVQVLSGYCVVIMRHCDSFGRPGLHRFLALLPETEGDGARTLASRMCKDIAAIEVKTGGKSLNFTISAGAAELHSTDRWAGDVLRRTEQALEDAIERGGNIAVLAEPPLGATDDAQGPGQQEGADST
jgi:diguanylate cyclase (GGDEF)-like protein